MFLSAALLFSLVVTKEICFENILRSLYLEQYVFFVQMQSRFGCASFRRLGSVLWLFTSCVWDVLWYRILKKTAPVSWAKQKLSKTSLSTFQNRLFELWWACCIGCNWKSCFENFIRSLYSEQYVFFVQMQSHVSAAPNFEGYVWSFGSLHPAFEMSCQTEYLQKQLLIFFGNLVFVVLDCVHSFWWFLYKSLKIVGQCHQNQLTFLSKRRWGQPKFFARSCAWLVSLVVNQKDVVRSSRD